MSFDLVFKDIQPTVIDNEMLNRVLDAQKPKGEAGRLFVEEGIEFSEVEVLRLEFMRILRIDHLWPFVTLTNLSLSNNYIEKIECLEELVNLKELDLSFNYIEKIENIENLVNLEILTFYNNKIKVIENMDALKQLHIFSIGKNSIEDRNSVFKLRLFKNLRSVNMADNPCSNTTDFRTFIVTFLPQIKYYEYIRVAPDEREKGEVIYRKLLEEVKDSEKSIIEQEEREEAERAEAELHAESFIEFLGGRQLFDSLFERDEDAKILMLIGEEVEQFYKEYEEEFLATTRQLFEVGQEQYELRRTEVEQFFYCVDTARKDNQEKSQQIINDFVSQKREIFSNIKAIKENFNYTDESGMADYSEQINFYAEDFNDLTHSSWKNLMHLELQLFDQIEEENLKFERILTEMVNQFIEQAQELFTICRNLESRYMEQVNDAALKLLSSMGGPDEVVIPEELKAILEDKEALNNCIGASHDMHMQLIDAREDRLVSRAKSWLNNLVENLTKNEITRNRGKVLEINHFLDIQREEFENVQKAPTEDFIEGSMNGSSA